MTSSNTPSLQIALIGGGGHACVMSESLSAHSGSRLVGFFDDNPSAVVTKLNVSHVGTIKSLRGSQGIITLSSTDSEPQQPSLGLVLAIGSLPFRRVLLTEFASSVIWGTIIHPSAIVSPSAQIGVGVFVAPRVTVNALARIGAHAIVNTGVVIEHECIIGENSHIAPGCTLCGNVTVGCDTFIGAGATILPGMIIGSKCIVGAGAVVRTNVPDGTTVVGVPARPKPSSTHTH